MNATTAPIAVVMAAGKGTRMKSDLPKVLVPLCGRPLVEYVLDAVELAGISRILLVVGYRADLVRDTLRHRKGITFVEQTEQKGTGHAVAVCQPHLTGHEGPVLVVTGDSPMTQSESLKALLRARLESDAACVLGSLIKDNPFGLGRIVRTEKGEFQSIVEEKDATPEQRLIREVNMSTYVFAGPRLVEALSQLRNDNLQGEYYITDCPGILRKAGHRVLALPVLKSCEALSINSPDELEIVEREMRRITCVN
jgi:bifunctional UDP-N-acetylglucosamine pyrophosphorylase / glucosamine-1-phosphate N-acetyltransferase